MASRLAISVSRVPAGRCSSMAPLPALVAPAFPLSACSSSRAAPLSLAPSAAAPHRAFSRLNQPDDGRTLKDFLPASSSGNARPLEDQVIPGSFPFNQAREARDGAQSSVPGAASSSVEQRAPSSVAGRSYYIETYGCQMNVSDTEIVKSILDGAGMAMTDDMNAADVMLVNTCSIRENAESKVFQRLDVFRNVKRKRKDAVVGVLGCMAERLKTQLLETQKSVDMVVGPDAYRDLPHLLSTVHDGDKAVNVLLSLDETYADITPVRPATNSVSAFISIMRGCDNMCSFCVVPFTRGRERSRDADSIVKEVAMLSQQGFKEVVLLGQNVNSYNFIPNVDPYGDRVPLAPTRDAPSRGFKHTAKRRVHEHSVLFTELMDRVSQVDPDMRVRFTSPHPKDFPDDLLHLLAARPNLCPQLHLPAQSGSSAVLERMRRGYTREAYIELVGQARAIIPNVAISSDFICGFCGETEEDHEQTLSLMREVGYDQAFMFKYSQRAKTAAHRRYADDVPEDIKQRRLQEVVDTFYGMAQRKTDAQVGSIQLLLIEGTSKKSKQRLHGRTDGNKSSVVDCVPLPHTSVLATADVCGLTQHYLSVLHSHRLQHAHDPSPGGNAFFTVPQQDTTHSAAVEAPRAGEYVAAMVTGGSGVTLQCTPLFRTTLTDFHGRLVPSMRSLNIPVGVPGNSVLADNVPFNTAVHTAGDTQTDHASPQMAFS